ncbi:MAG: DUF2267 domain-containing protein [Pseudomonadales bacterium]
MANHHVAAFDRTLQKTHIWIGGITNQMGWEEHEKGYVALRAVLHALRDRLPPDEAVDLAAQLPMLIRGIYFEGWRPSNKPLKYRHKEQFIEQVRREAPSVTDDEAERAVSAVFHQLSTEIDGGEVEDVRNAMPQEIREMWPVDGL